MGRNLYGKVDTFQGNEEFGTQARPVRPRREPGTIFDYNNTIWIDPAHDLVIVWRWHAANPNEFFKRLIASIRP